MQAHGEAGERGSGIPSLPLSLTSAALPPFSNSAGTATTMALSGTEGGTATRVDILGDNTVKQRQKQNQDYEDAICEFQ